MPNRRDLDPDDRHPLPEDRIDFPVDPDDGGGGGGGGTVTPPPTQTWWQKHGIIVIGVGAIVLIVGLALLLALLL